MWAFCRFSSKLLLTEQKFLENYSKQKQVIELTLKLMRYQKLLVSGKNENQKKEFLQHSSTRHPQRCKALSAREL